MTRVVYIGGFGSGRNSAETVGNALSEHFEEVDPFTFSDFIDKPERVQKAMRGVDLVTHSAGALAIAEAGSNPNFAYLLNPPLPRSVGSLVVRTFYKTARMNTPGLGIHKLSDIPSVAIYSASSVAELGVHPFANLSNLGIISRFNAIDVAINAMSRKIPSRLAWTKNDAYFKPSQSDLARARKNHVPVGIIPGEHDEVVLRPDEFLDQLLNF